MLTQTYKRMLTVLVLAVLLALPARAAGLIVVDPLTGLALGGYDPVSYFTEAQPLQGDPARAYEWEGAAWYFATDANLEIFRRAPEVYAPQYGGHDGMGVARGFLAQGRAEIFAVFKQRLYLFYSVANREAFLMAPDRAAREGLSRWPALSGRLVRN
jgi:YHS domain-containing protein